MRACILNAPAPVTAQPLECVDVKRPEPSADEVLIKIEACGICRTDLHVVEGELPRRLMPLIPGHQIVGTVESEACDGFPLSKGDRVGVAWLSSTCGRCRFCLSGRENLCPAAQFTGWTRHGGYSEYVVAPADFVYSLPASLDPVGAAPLLCAGIIGYRCLKRTGIREWDRAKLGIYGFGAAGHICIQIARARGARTFVMTRDRERHQVLATQLGAGWVGDTFDAPPEKMDAAIVFAPAGEIVPAALANLERGGTLVLGGIHMSPLPEIAYELLYGERSIVTVTNNTRADGHEFLSEAARAGVHATVKAYPLEEANQALIDLKTDAIKGAGVLIP